MTPQSKPEKIPRLSEFELNLTTPVSPDVKSELENLKDQVLSPIEQDLSLNMLRLLNTCRENLWDFETWLFRLEKNPEETLKEIEKALKVVPYYPQKHQQLLNWLSLAKEPKEKLIADKTAQLETAKQILERIIELTKKSRTETEKYRELKKEFKSEVITEGIKDFVKNVGGMIKKDPAIGILTCIVGGILLQKVWNKELPLHLGKIHSALAKFTPTRWSHLITYPVAIFALDRLFSAIPGVKTGFLDKTLSWLWNPKKSQVEQKDPKFQLFAETIGADTAAELDSMVNLMEVKFDVLFELYDEARKGDDPEKFKKINLDGLRSKVDNPDILKKLDGRILYLAIEKIVEKAGGLKECQELFINGPEGPWYFSSVLAYTCGTIPTKKYLKKQAGKRATGEEKEIEEKPEALT